MHYPDTPQQAAIRIQKQRSVMSSLTLKSIILMWQLLLLRKWKKKFQEFRTSNVINLYANCRVIKILVTKISKITTSTMMRSTKDSTIWSTVRLHLSLVCWGTVSWVSIPSNINLKECSSFQDFVLCWKE